MDFVIQPDVFAFLKEIFLFCYCLLCQKSIFGTGGEKFFKVFLPAMQLAALSCRDMNDTEIAELLKLNRSTVYRHRTSRLAVTKIKRLIRNDLRK